MIKAIYIAVVLALFLLSGCGFSEYQAKEDAKQKAILKAIMESESKLPGTKMPEALNFVLVVSGKYVKVDGWNCNKNVKDGSYDVWLNLTVNDRSEKLHWVVDSENVLHPANDLAQSVSVKQKLHL